MGSGCSRPEEPTEGGEDLTNRVKAGREIGRTRIRLA
jgi:hypothetical protein